MYPASADAANKAKTDHKDSDENGGGQRRTLVVDVGGSGIKATLLNDLGKAVGDRLRRVWEDPSWTQLLLLGLILLVWIGLSVLLQRVVSRRRV